MQPNPIMYCCDLAANCDMMEGHPYTFWLLNTPTPDIFGVAATKEEAARTELNGKMTGSL